MVILSWGPRPCNLSTGPAELLAVDGHQYPCRVPWENQGARGRTAGPEGRPRGRSGLPRPQPVSGWGTGACLPVARCPYQAMFALNLSQLHGGLRLPPPSPAPLYLSQMLQWPHPSPLHPNPALCSAWRPHLTQRPCPPHLA